MSATTNDLLHNLGLLGPPRLGGGPVTTATQLGPLASLPGSWKGAGFNAIWRPDNSLAPENSTIKRFLELNLTSESIDFHVIPGVVPNRGFDTEADLNLFGLHYLQRVSDADPPGFSTAGQALHIEPGLFMNVPASTTPVNPASIVRLASIPHGVTVLMQGPNPGNTPKPGAPTIPAVVPFAGFPGLQPFAPPNQGPGIQPIAANGSEHVVPEVDIATDLAFPASQSNGPYPADFQGFIADPNSVLRNAIAGQDILGFITFTLTTEGVGSTIGNIPFLGIANTPNDPTTPNAFVSSATATFWIEWVRYDGGTGPIAPLAAAAAALTNGSDPLRLIEPFWDQPTFLQLQYSQVVILIFNGVLWPHVTVATLTLSAG